MRHRSKKIILDRGRSARKALLRNLATSVILYERVQTTAAKARAVRPMVEHLVRIGRTNVLASRRQLLQTLTTEGAAKKVLEVFGPRYQSRAGGYLRITRIPRRLGDAAEQAIIEFV